MHAQPHDPHHPCDCAAHRASHTRRGAGVWSALLPVIACAACPVCLTTYAKLFSALGLGLGFDERQHVALLIFAIVLSVGVSVRRFLQTRRVWPLSAAILGGALVALGHRVGDAHVVEWVGVGLLFLSGMAEHFQARPKTPAPTTMVM